MGKSSDRQIYSWLSPSHTRTCLSFSRAIRTLKAECYSSLKFPIPMTWPSRELPQWFTSNNMVDDNILRRHLEQLHSCLVRDARMVKHEIPRLLEKLNLPMPPQSIFKVFTSRALLECYPEVIEEATESLQVTCDFLTRILDCAVFDRRELPFGWDMTHGWPEAPIGTSTDLSVNLAELAQHLEQSRSELHQQFPAPLIQYEESPEKYCRQIANAYRTVNFWQVMNGPVQVEPPTTIAEADSQLTALIMQLRSFEESESSSLTAKRVPEPAPARLPAVSSIDRSQETNPGQHEQECDPPDVIFYHQLEADILDILDGASSKVEPLATKLKMEGTGPLYKKNWRGLKCGILDYMRGQGWISHDPKLGGFYRPDSPPPSPQPKKPPKKKR